MATRARLVRFRASHDVSGYSRLNHEKIIYYKNYVWLCFFSAFIKKKILMIVAGKREIVNSAYNLPYIKVDRRIIAYPLSSRTNI